MGLWAVLVVQHVQFLGGFVMLAVCTCTAFGCAGAFLLHNGSPSPVSKPHLCLAGVVSMRQSEEVSGTVLNDLLKCPTGCACGQLKLVPLVK